ncbi:DUF3558 domain-containing protein [Prauserella oleivorans]
MVAVALLTACSDSEGGTPSPIGQPSTGESPASSSAAPSSSADPASDVPRVTEPLDISVVKQDPCAALPESIAAGLNLLPGVRDSIQQGPYCKYEYDDDSGSIVNVQYEEPFSNGLADVYARKEALGVFEPTTVSGYPAVYADRVDSRSEGVCQLLVGMSDTEVLTFYADLRPSTSDYPQGCAVAEKTAETVIENLKGGA